MIKKAVIPAAGLGTRFLPVTKSMPKEMLPIIDKPIIQFVIEEAIISGIEDKFRGKRYDAGDKQGYVKAIIDSALERADLREEVMRYLEGLA